MGDTLDPSGDCIEHERGYMSGHSYVYESMTDIEYKERTSLNLKQSRGAWAVCNLRVSDNDQTATRSCSIKIDT